jgi:hypothetical protein
MAVRSSMQRSSSGSPPIGASLNNSASRRSRTNEPPPRWVSTKPSACSRDTGDFIIWDNVGLMHTATDYDFQNDRRLVYQMLTKGDAPR